MHGSGPWLTALLGALVWAMDDRAGTAGSRRVAGALPSGCAAGWGRLPGAGEVGYIEAMPLGDRTPLRISFLPGGGTAGRLALMRDRRFCG